MTEIIRRPLMSGHCSHGGVNPHTGETGHERCHRQGGGQRANPLREFQPCPCSCHFVNEEGMLDVYECGGCGRDIVAAPHWPYDEEGDVRYTHLDEDSRAIGEDCPVVPKSKRAQVDDEPEPEPEPEPEQPDEDDEFADLDDLDALLADL